MSTGYAEPLGRAGSAPAVAHQYVFTPDATPEGVYSRPIILAEGLAYFFRAYNVPDGRHIYVNYVSQGVSPGGRPLDAQGPGGGMDLYIQRMSIGGAGNWVLSRERPQMIINLPGVYRFELEDPDMIGQDLCLEYSAVRCVAGFAPGVLA